MVVWGLIVPVFVVAKIDVVVCVIIGIVDGIVIWSVAGLLVRRIIVVVVFMGVVVVIVVVLLLIFGVFEI